MGACCCGKKQPRNQYPPLPKKNDDLVVENIQPSINVRVPINPQRNSHEQNRQPLGSPFLLDSFLKKVTLSFFPQSNIKEGKQPVQGLRKQNCMLTNHDIPKFGNQIHLTTNRGLVPEHLIQQNDYGFDTRKEVQNEQKYPYSCVGLILGKFTERKEGGELDRSFRGTGFLIGPNIILTCAHNAYSSDLKVEARQLVFYPAVKCDELSSADAYRIKSYYFLQQYKTASSQDAFNHDYAIMELQQNIGDNYGYLGFDSRSTNIQKGDKFLMLGYSKKEKQKFKFQMHEAQGKSIDVNEDYITYKETTTTGQSGGPIVLQRDKKFYAVGIHIAGYNTEAAKNLNPEQLQQKSKNYACHLTDLKRREINKWIQNNYYNADLNWQHVGNTLEEFLSHEKCIRIKQLILANNFLNDGDIKNLWEKKSFGFTTELDLSFNQLTNEGIQYLTCFPNLKKLNLYKNQLTKGAVGSITKINFDNLQQLNIGSNTIEDDGFEMLKKFSKLKHLKMFKINISNQGVKSIGAMRIQSIILGNNKVDDLQIFSKFKELKEIDLSFNKIRTRGLKEIKSSMLPKIQQLNLSGNELDDSSADHIVLLTTLVQLKIRDNLFTKKGVEKILARLKLKTFSISHNKQLPTQYIQNIEKNFPSRD